MRGLFVFIAILVVIAAPSAAKAACPPDIGKTVAQAKTALAGNNDEPLNGEARAALSCLADAVEILNAKLDDLIAGKKEFTGNVIAPGYLYKGKNPEKAGAE
jgi:hypothetical protein